MDAAHTALLVDAKRGPARFETANRLFFRLYQASNLLHKTGSRALENFGVTTQQWAILGALARPPALKAGMSMKALIEYLMVSRQSLTPVISRLAAAGLAERARGETDARQRRIRLTRKGRKTWGAMQPAIQAFYASALEGLDAEECLLLDKALGRLRGNFVRMG